MGPKLTELGKFSLPETLLIVVAGGKVMGSHAFALQTSAHVPSFLVSLAK